MRAVCRGVKGFSRIGAQNNDETNTGQLPNVVVKKCY